MSNYKAELHKIKAFVFDIDGVLTDGSVISTPEGDLLRTFDSKDGFGMRLAIMNGYTIGIITGGESESIIKRSLVLGIKKENLYLRSRNKLPDFFDFCKKNGILPQEVAFVGDDLPDICILQNCGLAVCPCDAVKEVKEVCHYISAFPGGKGCARDLVEQVLKVQGKWVFDPIAYSG
jgi:3-deoxy-D-manno-octulosonate 8-phosphate phosphatase (KDO 8-P phosphatase)